MNNKKVIEIIFDILIITVVISLYIFSYLFIYNDFKERKRKEISNDIIDKVDEKIDENIDTNTTTSSEVNINYKENNYTVIGKIRIRKINIYQPILKENTVDSYNVSVVKMAGPNLNEKGNVSIGGHNFMKGNFFIKINRLVKDDVVEITDLKGRTLKYYVYEYGITTKEDSSYLKQPDNSLDTIVTLVTCTKGGKERYYVKAKTK